MMLSLPTAVRIWLATPATDLRKSFDSLAELVRRQLEADPLSGQLFVFRNKRAGRVKLLYWDEDGFVIVYKRLEAGTFRFPAPRRPVWRSAPPTCRCCSTASIWPASNVADAIAGPCQPERASRRGPPSPSRTPTGVRFCCAAWRLARRGRLGGIGRCNPATML